MHMRLFFFFFCLSPLFQPKSIEAIENIRRFIKIPYSRESACGDHLEPTLTSINTLARERARVYVDTRNGTSPRRFIYRRHAYKASSFFDLFSRGFRRVGDKTTRRRKEGKNQGWMAAIVR